MTVLIQKIHSESRGTYGTPRVHAELRLSYGIRCSRKRVARLMRKADLVGVHRRKTRGITRRDPARTAYPDLVQRVFEPTEPNRVADLTQYHTAEGWLYLATVMDAYSRRIIGWAMGDRPVP